MDPQERSYRVGEVVERLYAVDDLLSQAVAWAALVGGIDDPHLRERTLRAAELADRLSRRSTRVVEMLRSATSGVAAD